jgi:hypothetical protein
VNGLKRPVARFSDARLCLNPRFFSSPKRARCREIFRSVCRRPDKNGGAFLPESSLKTAYSVFRLPAKDKILRVPQRIAPILWHESQFHWGRRQNWV